MTRGFLMMRTLLLCALFPLAVACGGKSGGESTAPADPATPDASEVPSATASAPADPALVARGAAIYEETCSTCHGDAGAGKGKSPAVVGAALMNKFPAADLLEYTKREMPKDEPGSLSDDDYNAVVAWMRSR
jgi:cytochrome c